MPGFGLYGSGHPMDQVNSMMGQASTTASRMQPDVHVESEKTFGGGLMSAFGGAAAGATLGAEIGSIGGPWGAAGGAVIGALGYYFG